MKLSFGDAAKHAQVNRHYKRQSGKHIVKQQTLKGVPEGAFRGMLRKLISEGDPTIEDNWQKRDFWISTSGALCYFSQKNNKPMVLVDGETLHCCYFRLVDDVQNLVYPHTFEIQFIKEDHKEAVWFAADEAKDVDNWIEAINRANNNGFGHQDMAAIRLRVNNQRGETEDEEVKYRILESQLWKLNQDGDAANPEEWRLRNMWLAKSGSLCYYSKQKPIQYLSSQNMKRCVVQKLDTEFIPTCKVTGFAKAESDLCCKQHAFTISLPPKDGIDFEPGVFAAQSAEECEQWIKEISKLNQDNPQTPE